MKWQIITPPACEPIDIFAAAAQCRLISGLYGIPDENWIIGIAIPNARATAEAEAQRSLITQTIAATIYDEHDAALRPLHSDIRLPRGPVQSITSVIDGNNTTLDPSKYQLRRIGLNDFLHMTTPLVFPIVITYVAGYGATGDLVPPDLVGIMLAHIAFLYDNRGLDVDPSALDRVYRRYRSFAQ